MDVALIGASVKCANVKTLQEFVEVIRNNGVCIGQPAEERILNSKIDKKDAYYPYNYLDRVDFFDHEFFNLSKGEANTIDPGHRMILEGVCDAIENSGYNLDYISSQNTGLFTTSPAGPYNLLYQSDNKGLDFIGSLSSIGGGRVANILNIRGPVMNIDTACSSSLVAVHEAVQKIKNGEIDLAIVAGSRLLYLFSEANSLENDPILSQDGMCRAFDDEASGTSGGEGVAVIILKRLDYAIIDNDTILSVIKGSAINNDGSSSNSVTAPSPVAQKNVILSACQNANIDIATVGYIETHGTGTKLGDPIEYKGIKDAFTYEEAPYTVRLGTLKPNIGHLDNMSGLFGLIKAALVLKEKEFFPLVNFSSTNKFIEEDANIILKKEGDKWLSDKPRRAGVSSFGLSGTNAHIILAEYSAIQTEDLVKNNNNWFKVSAKSKNALKLYIDNIYNFLSDTTEIKNLACTLNAGRTDYKYRIAVSGDSIDTIKKSLLIQKEKCESINTVKYSKIALLYLSDGILNIENFLECDEFTDTFSNQKREIEVNEIDSSVSQTLAFQVSIFKHLSNKGFSLSQLICNGSISKVSKEIIDGRNNIPNDLSFDENFSLDFEKLRLLAKNLNDNSTLLVIVGRNIDAINNIQESLKDENIPSIDLLEVISNHNWSTLWSSLYNIGLQFDWNKFYKNETYKKVNAPTYPFERVSCWNDIKNPLFFGNSNSKVYSSKIEPAVQNLSDEDTVVAILKEVLQNDNFNLTDDFFELGGNSIVGIQFINSINELFGIEIIFDDLFNCYEINDIVNLVKQAVQDKTKTDFIAFPNHSESLFKTFEVSNSQQRMWVESQIGESMQSFYNINLTYTIKGSLNIDVFKETLQELVKTHSCLRSLFSIDEDGVIQQKIDEIENIKVDNLFKMYLDNDSNNVALRTKELQNFVFDLKNGPLFQASIIQLDEHNSKLIFVFHHIIFDGWSTGIFIKDFATIYQQILNNTYAKLYNSDNYLNYLIWLKENLQIEKTAPYILYWKNKLKNINSNLNLGNYNVGSFEGARLHFSIDKILKEKLINFATKNRATLFSILTSSVRVTLYRLAQENFVIGTAVSGRVKKEFESTIGLFVNTLPIYTEIDGNKSFINCLTDEMETISKALEYQIYPYDLILNDLKVANKNSFFDVMVVLQNQNNRAGLINKNDLPFEIVEDNNLTSTFSRFNLAFTFFDVLDSIELELEYKVGVFSQKFIHSLMDTFFHLLEQFVETPEKNISQFSTITKTQFEEIIHEFNNTKVDYPANKTVIDLFEEQVEKTPNNVAVVFEETELTYQELNEQSNQLAHYLKENYAIEPNDLIGIKLDRSERMIVSILGIMKSGGAYIPMDVNYPQERIDFITIDANLKLCIDENEFEKFRTDQKSYDKTSLQLNNLVDSLAYCIYTSGSTGNPKGVLNHHAGLYNRLLWMQSYLNVGEKEVFLQKTPYTFDVSVWELILPFITGSSLVIAKPEGHKDVDYLQEIINKKNVSIVHFVPSMLGVFLLDVDTEKCSSLAHIVCSGEELPAIMAQDCKEKFTRTQLHNLYGPTEAAIDVTAINLSEIDVLEQGVSIGKPIANTSIYIVNNSLELLPVGVPGELLISGIQVARGYLNLPELTKDHFIADPFRENHMVYRTGDIAQWQPDGSIQYMGRMDNQVKIRGNRIELGEIENAIMLYGDIQQSVAMAKELNNEKVLVAYYLPEKGKTINKAELRNYLQEKLPEYMVPGFYVLLDVLPMTSSGKVDRKALPDIAENDLIRQEYVSPTNETEEKLVAIWQEILGIEKVGITDNFFELGGDSIRTIRILAKINKELEVNYKLADLYMLPSIKDLLSIRFDRMENEGSIAIKSEIENDFLNLSKELIPNEKIVSIFPMSDIELGMIFGSFSDRNKGIYHDQFIFPLPTQHFDQNYFVKAIEVLVEKHEILRTAYNIESYSVPVHLVYEKLDVKVDFEDISTKDYENRSYEISNFMTNERAQNPFDTTEPGLWRMKIYKTAQTEWHLLFQFHHAILDGWSVASLMTELNNIYVTILEGKETISEKLSLTYKDYVFEQNCIKKNDNYNDFWSDKLSDYKRLDIFTEEIFSKRHDFLLEGKNYDLVKQFSLTHGISLKTITFAAYLHTLGMLTYDHDVLVGIVTSGRPISEDGDKILGCFLNTVPFRWNETTQTTLSFVETVDKLLTIQKQFEGISLNELHNRFSLNKKGENPFFDTHFNYIDFHIYNEMNVQEVEKVNELKFNELNFEATNTFLDLSISPILNGLRISWNQQRILKHEITVERLQNYYNDFLNLLISNTNDVLNNELVLSSDEKQNLVYTLNVTNQYYPENKTIIDLFEEQVAKTPNNVAIVFEEKELTYLELNEQANKLGGYLRKNYAIEPDNLVGIKLNRSEKIIIAILGVLKSGAAYVPIDPSYPQERIDYIENDSNCKIVVDENVLELFYENQQEYSEVNIEKINSSKDLAYIIYTSGTTGNPKGVMVENTNVINLIISQTQQFKVDESEKILQLSNYTFDASVEQIFLALLNGAGLYIISREVLLEENALEEFIYKNGITHFHTVPSVIEKVKPSSRFNLKRVIAGGDICSEKLAESWSTFCDFYNEYGPTETTVTSIEFLYNKNNSFSIGRPISNTQVYILDNDLLPTPLGIPGKIYISGAGVTRGYLNKPELTAEKFIENPFISNTRMYDTGDLGRWLPDGNIEFLGRNDHQVKIRGFRIELGEIETSLLQFSDDLKQVVVQAKEVNGDKVLVAYYVADIEIDKAKIRNYLQTKLPEYMVPAFFVVLDHIPLTSNGKVNRNALPSFSGEDIIRKEYVAPRNTIEQKIAEIWQEVLGLEKVGVTDSFFELGGHSLNATKLISIIHKQFNVKLSIIDLFNNIILEELALLLENTISYSTSNEENISIEESESFTI